MQNIEQHFNMLINDTLQVLVTNFLVIYQLQIDKRTALEFKHTTFALQIVLWNLRCVTEHK